jgi:hypothetical protein
LNLAPFEQTAFILGPVFGHVRDEVLDEIAMEVFGEEFLDLIF